MKILILAGGKGTRLWPLCKKSCPKQFVTIYVDPNKHSLFQKAYLRALKLTNQENIYVITNKNYVGLVEQQLLDIHQPVISDNIIGEIKGKNTLPAILYGVKIACADGDDNVVVFPSDHKIVDEDTMIEKIKNTEELAQKFIVTFGMTPNTANKEYGYICVGEKNENGFNIKEFKEKPSLKKAKEYVANGYLWNSGIFMFGSKVFLQEVKKYSNDIYNAIMGNNTLEECYSKIKAGISVDYGVMEHTQLATVVPLNVDWSDLGGFDAFYTAFKGDRNNNICRQDVITLNSKNNLIITEHSEKVVIIGLNNIIAVERNGVLMLCKKGESYRIKEVVEQLEEENSTLL